MYGPRATQVTRTLGALASIGWQPTVVCLDARRGGPNWRDGVDVALPRGVETIRVRSPEESALVRALWRLVPALRDRPDPKWVWINRAAAAATAASAQRAFHGLVTFAQPWSDHLVGLRVHRATKLPWVAHFSDPWVDSPYWRGSKRQRLVAGKMEAHVIRDATAVVFVTEEAADLVMRKYPDEWRKKVAVVPHGFEAAPALKGPAHEDTGSPHTDKGLPAVALAKAGQSPDWRAPCCRWHSRLRTALGNPLQLACDIPRTLPTVFRVFRQTRLHHAVQRRRRHRLNR